MHKTTFHRRRFLETIAVSLAGTQLVVTRRRKRTIELWIGRDQALSH